MNRYGMTAMNHWRDYRPEAYAEIEDPTEHFTALGEQIEQMVLDLTDEMAGRDVPGEDFLAKVARLQQAQRKAEEIAFDELGVFAQPELDREEWESTTQEHERGLVMMIERIQEEMDREEAAGRGRAVLDYEIQDLVDDFMLPRAFLEDLISADSPLFRLDEPEMQKEWLESVERRWERDQANPEAFAERNR